MKVCIALLRGINVGGKHRLPMQALRDLLGGLGCTDVKTYIQSGNAVFSSAKNLPSLQQELADAILQQFGFSAGVHILTLQEFDAVLAANPFPAAVDEPKSLHVAFLMGDSIDPDFTRLEALRAPTERYEVTDHAFFLHAPDGIGRSKLAAKIDACLGVATTGRNWRSVQAIADLATSIIS